MSNHYRSVQAESFAMFDTVADDWEVCEINGLVAGRPNYKIPYKTVLAHSRNMVAREFIEGFTCELCGHPILNLHYIQCDDRFRNHTRACNMRVMHWNTNNYPSRLAVCA